MFMNILAGLFFIAALGVGLGSIQYVTNATLGVWGVAAGCLFGILARILQADGHASKLRKEHKELMETLKDSPKSS